MSRSSFLFLIINFLFLSLQSGFAQVQNPERYDPRWQTDTTRHSAALKEFIALLPRDHFPVITESHFLQKDAGLEAFYAHEPVISVAIDGKAKAYPLNILTYHEIAIDNIGETPVLITYCPLCNAGIAYDRRVNIDGQSMVLDFGVSGMLRKSDMVMWDKQTESWWQQLTGEAIVGKLTGMELEMLSSQILSVEQFFISYPKGKILSNMTGDEKLEKKYGSNPYGDYDNIRNQPMRFFQDSVDARLPAMTRIVEISVEQKHRIYPFPAIKKTGVINDFYRGKNLVFFFQSGVVSILGDKDIRKGRDIGTVTVFTPIVNGKVLYFEKKGAFFTDKKTRSKWDISGKCLDGQLEGSQLGIMPHSQHFAFSWLAFNPDSEIYEE